MVTGLEAVQSGIRIMAGARDSVLQNVQAGYGVLLSLLFIGYQGVFLELKWLDREVDCLPPCSAKVYSPYCVEREIFTFIFSGFKLE